MIKWWLKDVSKNTQEQFFGKISKIEWNTCHGQSGLLDVFDEYLIQGWGKRFSNLQS